MIIGMRGNGLLSDRDIESITAEALAGLHLAGKRLLVIIPDYTRKAPIDMFFRLIYELIGETVSALDYIVATGTHKPLTEELIFQRIGITKSEFTGKYSDVNFFNHVYDDPEQLMQLYSYSEDDVSEISNGLLKEELKVTINKRIYDYDHLLILSPVVPHESVGFSGGNKYFFPGIAGAEITNFLHWLGAVITNPVINGVKNTPVRKLIDKSASFIEVPHTGFCFVVKDDGLMCLYVGSMEESWDRAASVSASVHIQYEHEPYRTILGIVPAYYDDIWVAGKVMYKMEPVVADGGELIIYAPHVRNLSFTHDRLIQQVGYHVRDYFLKQWEEFKDMPRMILAHSTNVKGVGNYADGVENPRIRVTLATGIPEDVCRNVNLGFRDYRSIDVEEWKSRDDEGLLVLENAGQDLYRLKDPSKISAS